MPGYNSARRSRQLPIGNYRMDKEIYRAIKQGHVSVRAGQYIVRKVIRNYANPITTKDGRRV